MSGNLTKLAVAGAITTAGVIGFAGIASAHTGAGGLTKAECLAPGSTGWKVHLDLSATDSQLDPHANITYTGNQVQGVAVPYSHDFTTQESSFHASAHIYWSDGFTKDVDLGTVSRPPECVPPSTSTPPTTTCDQAIPPRGDCGTFVPPPPTTVPPIPTTTRVCVDGNAPSIPVEDGSLVCPEFFPPTTQAPVVHQEVVTTAKPIFLPTTGATTNALIFLGVGALAIGSAMILVRRRAETE